MLDYQEVPVVSSLRDSLLHYSHRPLCARFGMFASSGTGKSRLSNRLARMSKIPTMLIDPDPDPDPYHRGREVHSPGEIQRGLAERNAWIRVSDPRLFLPAARFAWNTGDLFVIVDEADLIFPRSNVNPEFFSLLQRGRRRGISVALLTQYPMRMHPVAQALCNVTLIGMMDSEAGKDYTRRKIGIEEIPPFTFILSNPYNHAARLQRIPPEAY